MMQNQNTIANQIDHLYRHEYGKLVAVLTKSFGSSNMELAEDVVQEAMIDALKTWSYKGIPDNPMGWVYKVARNKALNHFHRESSRRRYIDDTKTTQLNSYHFTEEELFSEQEIADDQLRMIFTCCHPSISSDSQVALTLKTLCGFSIPEISKAFFTSEDTINKRLVRARKTIKEDSIAFEVPKGDQLRTRLDSVLEAIYLLFNEGYSASSGDDHIRYELCEEAIRLAEMITYSDTIKSKSTVYALLALMTLNTARFKSRIDKYDNVIELRHQNRKLWDKHLVKKGLDYLEFATSSREVSIYHILATISAHHCTARSFENTNWDSILSLYNALLQIQYSPVVVLNKSIAVSMTISASAALKELESIEDNTEIQKYLPYYTTKASLLYETNQKDKAVSVLEKALKLTNDQKNILLINSKLKEFSENY